MDQLLQQQHAQAGSDNLSMDQLKDALGGILSYVKAKFPDGLDFSQITSALPEADDLVAKAESENATSRATGGGGGGGFLAGALGLLEQVTQKDRDGETAAAAPAVDGSAPAAAPVDSMSELIAALTKAGVNPQQVMSLLPVVAAFLKQHAGIDVSSLLGTTAAPNANAHTPGEDGTETTPAAGSTTAPTAGGGDAVGDLMSQAQGFLSNFQK